MKHKHCDLIKAWADGAQIEVLSPKNNRWIDTENPMWRVDREYRIKPKTLKLNIELSEDQAEALFDLINMTNEVTSNRNFIEKPFDSYKLFWREEALNNTRKTFVKPLNNFVADVRNQPFTKII